MCKEAQLRDNDMKKIIALILVFTLCLGVSCSAKSHDTKSNDAKSSEVSSTKWHSNYWQSSGWKSEQPQSSVSSQNVSSKSVTSVVEKNGEFTYNLVPMADYDSALKKPTKVETTSILQQMQKYKY